MAINRFPYQDDIIRQLHADGGASVSQIVETIASHGRHDAEGHDTDQLRDAVSENVAHLVNLGLAEYTSGDDQAAHLTDTGEEAFARLP